MTKYHVTEEEVMEYGFNSPDDSPRWNAAIHAEQLKLIGLLLLEIRDILVANSVASEETP